MVPQSFKGRKRQLQYIRAPVGQDIRAALAPAIEGRALSAPLLEHWRHKQVGSSQRPPKRSIMRAGAAVSFAEAMPPVWDGSSIVEPSGISDRHAGGHARRCRSFVELALQKVLVAQHRHKVPAPNGVLALSRDVECVGNATQPVLQDAGYVR